jgi:hypothetical protein
MKHNPMIRLSEGKEEEAISLVRQVSELSRGSSSSAENNNQTSKQR